MQISKAEYTKILNYARKGRNKQDAEELTQEAFTKAILRGEKDVKFIYQYVHDCASARHVKASAAKNTACEIPVDYLPVIARLDPYESVVDVERRALAMDVLTSQDGLPAPQRFILESIAKGIPCPRATLIEQGRLSQALATYHYKNALGYLSSYVKSKGEV